MTTTLCKGLPLNRHATSSGAEGGGAAEEVHVEATQLVEEAEGQHVWSEHTTDDGHTYYHNTVTDETSWTKPEIELKNVPAGTVAREQGSTGHSADI